MSNELSIQEQTYLPIEFTPGQSIQGRYELLHLIGAGGVCFVMTARHSGFDDLVALKFLQPEFANNTEAVSRFTIEARTCFKLRSAHIVRVFDVGMHAGTPFLAMELLEGEDLRSFMARQTEPVAIPYAVDLMLQTCEALSVAHSMGVIHRDIKPENLFLTSIEGPDHIKVLDFGISKVALVDGLTKLPITAQLTQIAVGTPPYMSPEQVRSSRDLDARADIWSVGCVLYELLTGQSPFKRESVMQSCAAVLEQDPAPPHELRGSVPLELSLTVMRCLRKQPAERYPDVAELAEALSSFGSGRYVTYAPRCRANLSHEYSARRATTPTGVTSAGHEVSNAPLSNSGLHPVSGLHSFSIMNSARTGGAMPVRVPITPRMASESRFDSNSQADDRTLEYSRREHSFPSHLSPGPIAVHTPKRRTGSRVAVGLVVVATAAGLVLYAPDGSLPPWLSQLVHTAKQPKEHGTVLRPAAVVSPATQTMQQDTTLPDRERAVPDGLAYPSHAANHSLTAASSDDEHTAANPDAATEPVAPDSSAGEQANGAKPRVKKSKSGKLRREDGTELQAGTASTAGTSGDFVDVGF